MCKKELSKNPTLMTNGKATVRALASSSTFKTSAGFVLTFF